MFKFPERDPRLNLTLLDLTNSAANTIEIGDRAQPMSERRSRPLTQWVASVVVKTRVGGRLSASTRARFPFGYFLVAEKANVR